MSQTLNCVDLLKILLLRSNVVGFRSNRASERWREQGREEDREEGRGAESENLRFLNFTPFWEPPVPVLPDYGIRGTSGSGLIILRNMRTSGSDLSRIRSMRTAGSDLSILLNENRRFRSVHTSEWKPPVPFSYFWIRDPPVPWSEEDGGSNDRRFYWFS
jgi:hypothetical protein